MSVSVCMAVRNGASFLEKQVNSILPQLNADDELIVSDDNSSDDSLKILNHYNDHRIKILPARKFGSPTKNFEYTLVNCKNEIIFLADQDDVWHLEKISVMNKELQSCDLVVCDCRMIDEHENVVSSSFFEANNSRKGLVKNLLKNSFVGCCMAFKKEVLNKTLPFPVGISMHDHWIGLVAQKHFRVKFIPQILVDHRRHAGNFSTTGGRSNNSLEKKLISRIKLAKMLLGR